jgi:putative N-acetyltransferase (TIGR04045 family)
MVSPDVRYRSSTSAEGAAAAGAKYETTCRLVGTRAELETHFAIREEVFVREQAMFTGTDRDERDQAAPTLHVLGFVGARPAGAVRLYPLDEEGMWQGDRLAVLRVHRGRQLGGPLVRFAVRTAAERAGRQMLAYIQPANVLFFQHLGWRPTGAPLQYCGRSHQRMVIDLEPWRRPE